MLNPPKTTLGGGRCDPGINTGQEEHVRSAALDQMQRWVTTGRPASSPDCSRAGARPGDAARSRLVSGHPDGARLCLDETPTTHRRAAPGRLTVPEPSRSPAGYDRRAPCTSRGKRARLLSGR